MSGYHAETFDTLRLIRACGAVTSQYISETQGVSYETAKKRLLNMRDKGLLDSNAEMLKPGVMASYSVSVKGKKLLAKADDPDVGEFPAPREPISRDSYIPKPWNIRAGGRDHESVPSRRGEELIEHRAVICAGAMPMAGRGLG